MDIKERINKCDHIKLKRFCMSQENISKMKKEPTVWENIFVNNTSDKVYISKIYKELTWLNTRKTNNPIVKWAKDLNRQFSKEDTQMAHGHTEKFSTSLAMREMQIKIKMRYHLTPAKMTIINKSINNKCWWGCGEKGKPSTLLVGMHTGAATVESSMDLT